jgi:hypothetical protein
MDLKKVLHKINKNSLYTEISKNFRSFGFIKVVFLPTSKYKKELLIQINCANTNELFTNSNKNKRFNKNLVKEKTIFFISNFLKFDNLDKL